MKAGDFELIWLWFVIVVEMNALLVDAWRNKPKRKVNFMF